MSEKVIIKELENQTIIHNEESPDTLIVTGPASPSETVIVTEAAPSTTIVEQAHPVTIMISHGGSAYIDAVNQGFVGTEVDWLNHILNSKAEVSYVDGLLIQEAADRNAAINNLAAQIARDFATKLELNAISSDINSKITDYDNQLKEYLNKYSTVQFVETQFEDRFGYMVQKIETLEGGLGNNSAIVQKINEIVLTESSARAAEITNLEARVGLNYATKNELSVVESTTEQARAALETSLTASFNNRISAEMTSVNESIATEKLARTTSYQQLEANFNNITVELDNLEQVISTETLQRAQAIQSLNAELVGYQQVQSTIYQEIDSRVGGNTTAIAGFRTAITGDPNATQTQAEIGLESIKTHAGDAYSRAYLTVSNTVDGVTTVTGITADSLNNMLAFSAGAMILRDSQGNPRLFWTETTDTWTFSGKLILGDGSSFEGIEDIQALVGPRHYIKSLNGTAIKNHTGTLTVEARTVTGTLDELSNVGYLRTADNPSVNLGNKHTFTAAEISDSVLVEMVVSGVVRDTITLVDITDGEDGSDAIVGFVEAGRISWVQDSNGVWPTPTTNTVTAYFYQKGAEIAKQVVNLSLQTTTGFINHSIGSGNNVSVTTLGSGTNEVTLKFTHIPSGIQVVETFFSVTKGKDGPPGEDGPPGKDGTNGTHGAGFYGSTYSSISWNTSTANNRFTALVGRAPIPLDIFVQTLTNGSDSQARQYNGSSWVAPTLMVHGSMIATGTVAGQVLIAGTELSSPVVKSGQILMVGPSHMKITAASPFGPNDLIEWYGPKNSYTYDSANNLVKFDGLTKANAIMYLSATGQAFFGGSIIAGTLRSAAQSAALGSNSVTVGPFGSNGGLIEIKCSVNISHSTGVVLGPCPLEPSPSGNPNVVLRLYRDAPGASTLVAEQTVTGTYECLPEGQEHIEFRHVSGGFTFTDNLQTPLNRTYRLHAAVYSIPLIPNQTTQRISLVTEEA